MDDKKNLDEKEYNNDIKTKTEHKSFERLLHLQKLIKKESAMRELCKIIKC